MYAAREALSQSGNIINAFHITIESDWFLVQSTRRSWPKVNITLTWYSKHLWKRKEFQEIIKSTNHLPLISFEILIYNLWVFCFYVWILLLRRLARTWWWIAYEAVWCVIINFIGWRSHAHNRRITFAFSSHLFNLVWNFDSLSRGGGFLLFNAQVHLSLDGPKANTYIKQLLNY